VTDVTELYAAVLADPFDMDLRLRYADAIVGVDPEHAELIRLQISCDRLAIAGEPVDDPKLIDHARQLSWKVAARIGGNFGGLVDNSFVRRGFAEILLMSGTAFLARCAELSRIAPWRGAVLSHVDAAVAADLAASPLLGRLAVLDLSGNPLRDDGIKALLTSPHLGRVRWLGLNRCRIDQAGSYVLGTTAHDVLPDLRYLGFDDNPTMLTPFIAEVPGGPQSWDAPVPAFEIVRPPYGVFLDTRFGPFPWLSDAYVRSAPAYTAV
jgi:uncharacterized protein (TIGR02996 family)